MGEDTRDRAAMPDPSASGEIAVPPKRKNLRLTIEVPDVYADDLDEHAGYLADGEPTDEDRLWLVTEEWFREDVVVVLTSFPGDKCQNHEFEVMPFKGRIVGAATVDDPNASDSRSRTR